MKKLTWWQKCWRKLAQLPSHWWLIFALLFILVVQIPIFFAPRHPAYDLYPYPDSIIYAVGAKNLATGRGYGLFYKDAVFAIPTPPLYIFYLVPFALLLPNSLIYFVAGNIVLQMITIFFFYLILKKIAHEQKRWYLLPLGFIFYFSHSVFSLLPSLALIENLGIPLIMIVLWLLLNLPTNKKQICGLFLAAAAFVFTKYTYLPLSFAILCLIIYKLSKKKKPWFIIGLSALFILVFMVTLYTSTNLATLIQTSWQQLWQNQADTTFSFVNLSQSIKNTLEIFGGGDMPFGWNDFPLCAPTLALCSLFLLIYSWQKKFHQETNIFFTWLILAQLPLILIFDATQSRYFLLILPIMIIIILFNWPLLAELAQNCRRLLLFLLIATIIGAQIYTQQALFLEIIQSNFTHTYTEELYTANLFAHQFMQNYPEDYLITLVPPYYYDYINGNTANYQLLPMTIFQHFTDAKQKNWGSYLDYEQLLHNIYRYYQALNQKNNLYLIISNKQINKSLEFLFMLQSHFELIPQAQTDKKTILVYQLKNKL